MSDLQLLLVDLDNVRTKWVGELPMPSASPGTDASWLESRGEPAGLERDDVGCVVAFAFNVVTATQRGVDYAWLGRFADRLAHVVANAELIGVEYALTLDVKQSADKALERLMLEAPRSEHQGSLIAVHALTSDGGLVRALGRKLGNKRYDPRHEDATWVRSWRRKKKRGVDRRYSAPLACVEPSTEMQPSACTEINTAKLVAWARNQSLDLSTPPTLCDLANDVEERPGLLTQLGITAATVRGVARMNALATGEVPPVGDCGPTDGVELRVANVRGHCREPRVSPVGPGAVRFDNPAGTACTTLPVAVLEAVEGPIDVGRVGVFDKSTIKRIDPKRLQRSAPVEINFRIDRSALVVSLKDHFGVPFPMWWWPVRPREGVKGPEFRLEWDGDPPPLGRKGASEVHAVPFLSQQGAIDLEAPLSGWLDLDLRRDLQGEELGEAHDGQRKYAVLAPIGGCSAGRVACRPIQDLPDRAWIPNYPTLQRYAEKLRRLPLVTPA